MSRDVGWSESDTNEFGNPVKRFLILATDNLWHKEGDAQLYFDAIPQIWTDKGPDCLKYDYPSVSLVSRALRHKRITPMILLSEIGYMGDYWRLLDELTTGGTVEPLASDSSDVVSAIHKVSFHVEMCAFMSAAL